MHVIVTVRACSHQAPQSTCCSSEQSFGSMPRFVAIRDCLGFHASYEGVVGIVGELTDRELNPLVHHYPGMIYKASFNTADQAVQWLWTEVYNRPADQDLRARQFEFDARLFPMAIASSLCLDLRSNSFRLHFVRKLSGHSGKCDLHPFHPLP